MSVGLSGQRGAIGAVGFGNDSGVMGGVSFGAGSQSFEFGSSYGIKLGNIGKLANVFCK